MVSNEPIFSLDWAPEAIIVTGSDGSVLHVNPRAEDLFGYRKEELVDKPLALLIPEGIAGAALDAAPLQRAGRTVVCAHRDGTRFLSSARWRPARAGGESFLVISLRDREREEPWDAAGDAVRAELGGRIETLSLFAHDVREPLQAIQYLCDALGDRAPAEAAAVSEIIGSVRTLLERLTRFSDSAAIEPQVETCRLGDLLGSLAAELAPLADRKGLRLFIAEVEDEISTDPVLFRELLHNLLANAIRYTEAGHVDVRCEAGPDVVRVEIIDTGVGIERDHLAAMLAPASRPAPPGPAGDSDPSLEDTLARDLRVASLIGDGAVAPVAEPGQPGTADDSPARDSDGSRRQGAGLGFAIVQQLARLLDCSVEVHSTPGRGSRFSVVAPRTFAIERRRREHDRP